MADQATLRRRLVRELRKQCFLHSDRVADAFSTVPRHVFVPGYPMKDVYTDRAFVTKQTNGVPTSSSSQPAIMAAMLEQLQVEPGQRVLEIGAGTGYNAALLSRLAGAGSCVTTVDIDPDVAEDARHRLASAGCEGVNVATADGGYGEPDGAPYDRIIATAGCWQIPQPWVDQLVEDGIMVVPLRLNGPHLCLAFRKEGDVLRSTDARECGFIPLRGAFGPKETRMDLPGMRISADVTLDAEVWQGLESLLNEHRKAKAAYPRGRDGRNSPLYYLTLQGMPVLRVLREKDSWGSAPFVLVVSPGSAVNLPWYRPKRNNVIAYGGDEALEFLRRVLDRWRAQGCPGARDAKVIVRPSREQLGPLPRRVDGHYRFSRGGHLYELWFKR
jgi:protein-L-isoaspartate(D-aspartate) O-methyltransferase